MCMGFGLLQALVLTPGGGGCKIITICGITITFLANNMEMKVWKTFLYAVLYNIIHIKYI